MTTILDLASDAAVELGLHRPATLFAPYNERDASDQRLVRAMTRAVRYFAATYDWSVLKARHTWTSVAAPEQPPMPGDWLRPIAETAWDHTLRRALTGPISDQELAEAAASVVPWVEPVFAIRANRIVLTPAPAAGHTLSIDYIRHAIGRDASGAYLSRYTADTDTTLYDDELVVLGTIWQLKKMEGQEYAQAELDAKLRMQDCIKRDGGGLVLRSAATSRTSHDLVARVKQGVIVVPS